MRTFVAVCVIAASAFIGPPVWAELSMLGPVPSPYNGVPVDQYNQYSVGSLNGEAAPDYWASSPIMAQTFKAVETGRLYAIQIGNTTEGYWGPVSYQPTVEIFDAIKGDDGVFRPGSALGSGSVRLPTALPTDGWASFDFFTKGIEIEIIGGRTYSIVLSAYDSTSDNRTVVSVGAMTYPESYPDGALWASDNNNGWKPYIQGDIPVYDMQFRTYVVPVPLPAGVWLGIFAVSVAGWHLKRQMA